MKRKVWHFYPFTGGPIADRQAGPVGWPGRMAEFADMTLIVYRLNWLPVRQTYGHGMDEFGRNPLDELITAALRWYREN